jgi:hypothetical protein
MLYNIQYLQVAWTEGKMQYLRLIFRDWPTRIALVVFVLIIATVIFNTFTGIPQRHPLLAVMTFSLVPLLFVLGGIFFTMAMLKGRRK